MKQFSHFFSYLTFLFILLGMSLNGFSQEEEDCGLSTNKKAIKEFEKAIDKKKYGYRERMNYYNQALELDSDFTLALWNKTFARIKDARGRHKPYQSTLSDLLTVVEECPQMHSAAYFFLGEIYMNDDEFKSASVYYDKFLHFRDDNDNKYERRYEEQVATAKINLQLANFLAYQYANPLPFNPVKVSPLSTSDKDEYLPSISPDNEVMLYTRRFTLKDNEKDRSYKSNLTVKVERFSVSSLVDGKFGEGQAFGDPFNTNPKANYGGAAISSNNKEIFFTICEPVQGKMNCDIYVSNYVMDEYGDGVWTEPKNLGPNINTEDGWEAQPTISKDGSWLMYAVFKEGTRGIDLFESYRNQDGTWQQAKTMGEPINTAGDEKSPFFHSDDKTLYFASRNGHVGLGGYDVFMSKIVNDEWTNPVNIGYPLNSSFDEHGYIVSLDGKTAYFGSASPLHEGKGKSIDLYQIVLPEKIRPEKVLMVKGIVKTIDNKVPKDATVELRNTKTQEVESFKVDTVDGSYTAIVNVEDTADYMLTAKGKDIAFNNKLVKAPKEKEPIKTRVNIEVQKSKVGQHITIENIHFATNSANLSNESRASLDALIKYMLENPHFKASVEGHTDNRGDANANLALSTDRAYSVMAYLQENGIKANRLKFKGWGSVKPIGSNKTTQGRAENRRIEIVVLSK